MNVYNEDRIMSHYPKYMIYKYSDNIKSYNGLSLDAYSLNVKKEIYKNLILE